MHTTKPVLVIGGSGVVGSQAVTAFRQRHTDIPIAIGARNLSKATQLAKQLGNADVVAIDLERQDLGLSKDREFSAVAVLLKDTTLNSMRFAQDRKLPYLSFSNFVFDIGPEVGLYIQHPKASPILLLGHFLGGTVYLAALQCAARFKRVSSIAIGAVFDKDDAGGPAAEADIAHLSSGAPAPLMLQDGAWRWVRNDATAARTFTDMQGNAYDGRVFPLLDVVDLAAATHARNIRLDLATRTEASATPSHKVIIEIAGELHDGRVGTLRQQITDNAGYSRLSGYGAALGIEGLLGLGQAAKSPVSAGLYAPDQLVNPPYAVATLKELGIVFSESWYD